MNQEDKTNYTYTIINETKNWHYFIHGTLLSSFEIRCNNRFQTHVNTCKYFPHGLTNTVSGKVL